MKLAPNKTACQTLLGIFCILSLGILPSGGCGEAPPPKPTESKEQRMEKEKAMMHREMQNK